jgi:response regulator RpfG family c-di-GMP phosphodiesterase
MLAEAVNGVEDGPLAEIHFSESELKELRYTALLHDFGKVGVRESVLTKSARISETEMGLVEQRFSSFKNLVARSQFEGLMTVLDEESRPPNPEELTQIREACEAFDRALNEDLETLKALSVKRSLTEAEIQEIKRIGAREIPANNAAKTPLLTEDELKNLTIAFSNLNKEEWENMRSHAKKSEVYLERIPWSEELKNIPRFAGAHHEKLDGSGYPLGIDAKDIPIQVRMLTIADIYDAVTASDRSYKRAMDPKTAADLLIRESAAGQLDQSLVDLFCLAIVPKLTTT